MKAFTRRTLVLALCFFCVLAVISAPAQVFRTVIEFNERNGASPAQMSPIQGRDGNLYGTTGAGGANCEDRGGCGTVFRVTPGGQVTVLHSFCADEQNVCPDGLSPFYGLTLGTDGNFYGTTYYGGGGHCTDGCGTVFRITPAGKFTLLHVFNVSDGSGPQGLLLQGVDGSLYGTTNAGGDVNCGSPYGCGTIFRIGRSGVLRTLHTFELNDGAGPTAGLLLARDGNFYGTTEGGGAFARGTVFQFTPAGKLTTVHSFNVSDGKFPHAAVIQARDGNLYGTTSRGGANDAGTIFQLRPSGGLTVLYAFDSMYSNIQSGLVEAQGKLYGTTYYGGDLSCQPPYGCGTVFELDSSGVFTVLHEFNDPDDGVSPDSTPFQATSGVLYGSTIFAGGRVCELGCGTVFSLDNGLHPFVSLVRAIGKTGQVVDILGQDFKGTTSVTFNGTSADFNVVSDTYLTATVPPGATSGYVSVAGANGKLTSNQPFQVIP